MSTITPYSIFVQCTKDVHNLKQKPDNTSLLELYSYYKQATVGDINVEKPSFFNFKETAKWDSWANLKGMSKIQAQVNYIKIVKNLQEK